MLRNIWIDVGLNGALALRPIRRAHDRLSLARGYDRNKDSARYARGVFEKHAPRLAALREISGSVLEIGPGGNVGTMLLFLEAGADRGICMDIFPWVNNDQAFYDALVSRSDVLLSRIEYRCPDAIETTELPDETIDLIYSHACLEHVQDPAAAVRVMARLLKPGGAMSHQIDLRDHRDFGRPLDFLNYSERLWNAATSRRVPMNRWRASEWRNVLEDAGLTVVDFIGNLTTQVTVDERRHMHPGFQSIVTDEEILGLQITATKPR